MGIYVMVLEEYVAKSLQSLGTDNECVSQIDWWFDIIFDINIL